MTDHPHTVMTDEQAEQVEGLLTQVCEVLEIPYGAADALMDRVEDVYAIVRGEDS